MKQNKEELKRIREERKKLEEEELKEIQKPQRRSVELIEFEDGTYALSNKPLWVLPLQKDEVLDALEAWKDGTLEGIPLI